MNKNNFGKRNSRDRRLSGSGMWEELLESDNNSNYGDVKRSINRGTSFDISETNNNLHNQESKKEIDSGLDFSIEISTSNYDYYHDPFENAIGENEILIKEENKLVINKIVSDNYLASDCFLNETEAQRSFHDKFEKAINDFYQKLNKTREKISYDNIGDINKDIYESFVKLRAFILLTQTDIAKQDSVESKINFWERIKNKKWYYWLIFPFVEARLYFLRKKLEQVKVCNLDNFNTVFANLFSSIMSQRVFYQTLDRFVDKNFKEQKNMSINELLSKKKDIFKIRVISRPKNILSSDHGNQNEVFKIQLDDKNYFYKVMNSLEEKKRFHIPFKLINYLGKDENFGSLYSANTNSNYEDTNLVFMDANFRQLGLNVISDYFGFDNIVHTELVCIKDNKGNKQLACLMEEAPGKQGFQVFLYFTQEEKTYLENYIAENNINAELLDASRADVQIESLKLGIVDCIGLNPDRHAGNFFVSGFGKGEKIKSTGIDNDFVFLVGYSERKIKKFFRQRVPFITTKLRNLILEKLGDDAGQEKLLSLLAGKMNIGPGETKSYKQTKNRIRLFAEYIRNDCPVIDNLNEISAQKFRSTYWFYGRKDNPISALYFKQQFFWHKGDIYSLQNKLKVGPELENGISNLNVGERERESSGLVVEPVKISHDNLNDLTA